MPYVIAVATASNIGSVATITGNPQNMLIGSLSGIAYAKFLVVLAPVAVAGLLVAWALIHRLYLRGPADLVPVAASLPPPERLGAMRRKPLVVLAFVLAAFLFGVPPAMAAAVGAALLLITRTVEPRRVYDEVDWGLLVFFVGLFVIVGGADRAGLTATLLRPVAGVGPAPAPGVRSRHHGAEQRGQQRPGGHAAAGCVVPGFPDPETGWLALAMASTLAGNLTITGSVANIIVVESAAGEGVHVSYREYFRVGLPLTLLTLAVGGAWLWAIS